MTHTWISVVDERPADAAAVAAITDGGEQAGFLAAWSQRRKPDRLALRAHPGLVDRRGKAAWISLVLGPAEVRLAFDDQAVVEARRRVLANGRHDAVSALMRDASHFEGSITVARGPAAAERLADDPFGRIFPARLIHVGPGVVGDAPPPVGPSLERYGSANPWPGDRFEDAR